MKPIILQNLKNISGGSITFNNGAAFTVTTDAIPTPIFQLIETNLQAVIDGKCSIEQFFSIIDSNDAESYLTIYFENLDE